MTQCHSQEAAALRAFSCAMKRYEKRARDLIDNDECLAEIIKNLRRCGLDSSSFNAAKAADDRRRWLKPGRFFRGWNTRAGNVRIRRERFLYALAADAVVRLRAALAETT